MFVNVHVAVSPPRFGELPPPETVFSESFVSPNGAWNILHMIKNSNKMNNKHPQPARALYEALSENTEPHQHLIQANIWRCQWQMPKCAEADEWAQSYLGLVSNSQLGLLLLWRQASPFPGHRPGRKRAGKACSSTSQPKPSQPTAATGLWPCPQGRGGGVRFIFSFTFPFHRNIIFARRKC